MFLKSDFIIGSIGYGKVNKSLIDKVKHLT